MYIDQPIALGTGHAIQCCRDEIYKYLNTNVLVLSGDVPLLSSNTMFSIIKDNKTATILTTAFDKPDGYGRIIEKDDHSYINRSLTTNSRERNIELWKLARYEIPPKIEFMIEELSKTKVST